MIVRFDTLWERLRSSYWFVPAIMASLATGLSFAMAEVDAAFGAKYVQNLKWIYAGGPEGARTVLGTIAGSVIGVAGTTFSILIAVLSLTSGQFGPRLLRGFMRDKGNQLVLGAFTSTFLYCLLVLRTIRGTEQTTYVPHFSVTVGVVLAIVCVGVLIYFIHHVAESIQVTHLINETGKEADQAVDRVLPQDLRDTGGETTPLPPGEAQPVCSGPIGYVESIDVEALLRISRENGFVVKIEVRPGEYVLPNMRLLSVWPGVGEQEKALRGALSVARQRTTIQDAEFAFLQLAEIAVRALSPGINDPFTAMQCLDRITASMCIVASRKWPNGVRRDDSGAVRVLEKLCEPRDLVEAAYGHIRHSARDHPVVRDKLEKSIESLIIRAKDTDFLAALEVEKRRIQDQS